MKTQVDITLKFTSCFFMEGDRTRGEAKETARDSILRILPKTINEIEKDHPGLRFLGYDWNFQRKD